MYDQKTEDRALNELYRDIEAWQDRPPRKPQTPVFGLALSALLLAVFGALCLLIAASGCSTVAGVGRDLTDLAEGTREAMQDEPDQDR